MRSHDAIAIVSSHHPKGTILQFWGNSRILNTIHNHSANSSANRTITLWFRHNPPDCGGFTPCRSASISIHTILWSFLQSIPDKKIHQQLQNLLTILGCLPQSVWITSRLQVRKGLQVDWKDCIEIGWIAEQQRKTMTTWVNSWTQHQSTALPPNVLRGSWIAPFFCKSRHNADGFRGNSRIWCNLLQSGGEISTLELLAGTNTWCGVSGRTNAQWAVWVVRKAFERS